MVGCGRWTDSRAAGFFLVHGRMIDSHTKASHDRVYAAIAAIPRGRVASYGAIAARAGLPGRARLVGKLLGETPVGMELPWFRVLRASGQIALPPGSRGFREQCRRLRAEGVEVHNGRVPLSRFGLDANLDRALWGMPGA
jgi:methylated-DNA-protein-cysteine methyltransferase-like protein